jgi:N-acetylglutamate synthase-like GNAT family acetyltransferase
MDAEFLVRPFRAGDQVAVEALVLGVQRDEFGLALDAQNQPDLADVARFFRLDAPDNGGSGFWVAEAYRAPSPLVGCIGLEVVQGNVGVMRKFMVHADWRGSVKGVAVALYTAFDGRAKALGLSALALSTVSSTQAAQRFYERHGYHRVMIADLPPGFRPGVLDTVFYLKPL